MVKQRRLGSGCADGQPNLYINCSHRTPGSFSHTVYNFCRKGACSMFGAWGSALSTPGSLLQLRALDWDTDGTSIFSKLI